MTTSIQSIDTMMIFAAGRGTRLQPLTNHCPKPLIKVCGKPLIEYHIEKAQKLGIKNLVINVSYLGSMIREYLGNGSKWGLEIAYSDEIHPLETAGGLVHARHLINDGPFIISNADIYHEYDLEGFLGCDTGLIHLLMVQNPPEQPAGNFYLTADGLLSGVQVENARSYTYSGIGLYNTDFIDSIDQLDSGIAECQRTPFYLKRMMQKQLVKGILCRDLWCDVGTPERLKWLECNLCANND